jgi:RNA polymerase sigma factor (sigma-70 family)
MEWSEIYTRLNADREDGEAWEALARRVRAWAHAHLRGKAWHHLEDVVADTCSSVAVAFDRARGEATFAGFVYGCYLNERRRVLGLRRGRSACLSLDEPDLLPSVGQPDVTVEDPPPVWEVLLTLPARQRAAVTLRHLEGLSAEDIAAHLGVSPVNARQLVHKGLLALRRRLATASV